MKRCSAILLIFFLSLFLIANDAHAINKKLELAERLYLQDDYRAAAYECDRLFSGHKKAAFKCEIAYLGGLSYLKLDEFVKAKKYFEYVIDISKDEIIVREAGSALGYIQEKSPSIKEPQFYCAQVGSFKSKRNADRLYKKFKRRKYTVRIEEKQSGRVTIYKVKIGKFKTRKEAVVFAGKLKRIGYQAAITAY
ncbi:MAG: SPOR domain-containing protein [Candidatus Omnitrophica bacterium]|nr:SPOR domain-containing protein [Candidatus Omnitrophota bacterium]